MIFRQGDVLLIRLDDGTAMPEGGPEPRDDGRVVLAYGEVTGHAHAILDASAALWRIAGEDRLLTVAGDAPIELRHEEHATVFVPPGAYVVRRQREYAPGEDDGIAAQSSMRTSLVAD